SFAGGASPANTSRELLPVLPKAAFAAACDLFDEIAQAAGLTAIKAEQGSGTSRVIYDLVDGMVFESDSDIYRLNELEDALCVARHEGRELKMSREKGGGKWSNKSGSPRASRKNSSWTRSAPRPLTLCWRCSAAGVTIRALLAA